MLYKFFKIRSRIFLVQILVVLLPFISVATAFYNINKNNLERLFIESINNKNNVALTLFNDYKYEIEMYANLIAQRDDIKRAVNSLKDENKWDPEDHENPLNYPNPDYSKSTEIKEDKRIVNLRNLSPPIIEEMKLHLNYIGNLEIFNKNKVTIMRGHRDFRGDI